MGEKDLPFIKIAAGDALADQSLAGYIFTCHIVARDFMIQSQRG
jgi:hypothetical protein